MQLRPYQQKLHDDIYSAWSAGARVVMAQLPTGGGKTVTFSHIVAEEKGASIVMAHRRELICQMSLALAREGVRHRVFGPPALARLCTASHMDELKINFINPLAQCAVASVQTLAAITAPVPYFQTVRQWVGDEGHHYLKDNQFGRVTQLFPHARGLLVTATPGRADGRGLGSHADGLADVLVRGPDACDLIEAGYLSPFRIFVPPSTFNRAGIKISDSTGEFNAAELKEATRRSSVIGDIVEHYCRVAHGKLGLTFADSIENATAICEKFRAAGVPAEVLTGKTPDSIRDNVLRRFRKREVWQIVSVALIDEGFDCPAVEVVSDGAATESFGRYAQRFGRGLRILPGKTHMIYFDHVGNVERHRGPPTNPRPWSLDRRERRSRDTPDDVPPYRTCPKCTSAYEAIHRICPFCHVRHEPKGRSLPEQVDGVLSELTPEALAALMWDAQTVLHAPAVPYGATPIIVMAKHKHHRQAIEAQTALRAALALWGGWREANGETTDEAQARFYFRYKVDVATAQGLPAREAVELAARVTDELTRKGVSAV